MKFEYTISNLNFSTAGKASSNIKKILKLLGIDSKIIRRAAIATYEVEINIAIHSHGGKIILYIEEDSIKITAIDKGPGIENIELAMKEGYSTATHEIREMGFGAGMGLPNIKKCSNEFSITSEFGKYTKLEITIFI
ncbi:MAG: anti-sigma regulatory factor [Clostridiales bacterium]|nr:anti-sigma regulatory factor [Clostridiales bacterium]